MLIKDYDGSNYTLSEEEYLRYMMHSLQIHTDTNVYHRPLYIYKLVKNSRRGMSSEFASIN